MKTGFVALIGRPNVGKSTILNSILKQKISIVTDKSQTTRNSIKGIYNDKDSQIVFVDTPGIHKPNQKLGIEMNKSAYSTSHDVDIIVLVVDTSMPFGNGDQYILDHVDFSKVPTIIAFNKIDLSRLDKAFKLKEIYHKALPNALMIDLSAKEKFNINELVGQIKTLLPEGPLYYDIDQVSDEDYVFQIKEIIREKILLILKQEVPHSVAIYLNDADWENNPMHIKATIVVEKDSQKGIVIGANGSRIKLIGSKARQSIEALLKKHVFLELFVKVDEDWRNTDESLAKYGYKTKEK